MELVVVVVIIGIMTALIIPEMSGTFQAALLRSTGREIVNVFSLANSHAVNLHRSCRVRLDSKTGRYLVERKVNKEGQVNFVPLKDVAGSEGTFDPRIAIQVRQPEDASAENKSAREATAEAVGDTIAFYPDGTADAAEILLSDPAGFQIRLQLNPVTARVQIVEPESK